MYMYLIHLSVVDVVDHKFLISGHSFLGYGSDFAIIEKKRQKKISFVPDELVDVTKSAHHRPLQVEKMDKFFDFKSASGYFLNTTKICLSTAVWIRVDQPRKVMVKRYFTEKPFENFTL